MQSFESSTESFNDVLGDSGLEDDDVSSNDTQRESIFSTRETDNGHLYEELFYVCHNVMAMKLLGSRKRIAEELERQKHYDKLVIHPCSKFR